MGLVQLLYMGIWAIIIFLSYLIHWGMGFGDWGNYNFTKLYIFPASMLHGAPSNVSRRTFTMEANILYI